MDIIMNQKFIILSTNLNKHLINKVVEKMALRIGDNFSYLGKKFLDSRESFDTLQEMYTCSDVPEGFITYCKEDKKRYEFTNTIYRKNE